MTAVGRQALERLLVGLFEIDELRHFLHVHYTEVNDGLPPNQPASVVIHAAVGSLARRGWIDRAFFASLRAARPGRQVQIDRVARLCSPRQLQIEEPRPIRRTRPLLVSVGFAAALGLVAQAWQVGRVNALFGEPGLVEQVSAVSVLPVPRDMCSGDMALVTPAPGDGVAPFCLDRREVTRASFGQRGAGPAKDTLVPDDVRPLCNHEGSGPRWGEHPMTCVSPRAAERSCARSGRRLPTRREWVRAALLDLGGRLVASLLGAINLCGAECSGHAHRGEFARADPHPFSAPVGTHARSFGSRLGVDDLFGNARELVAEDGRYYACGSGWSSTTWEHLKPEVCLDLETRQLDAREGWDDIGFRCAADPIRDGA